MQESPLNPASPNDLPPAVRELERALSELTLRRAETDPDRMLFQAGRSSAFAESRPAAWAWRGLAAALTAGLGVSLLWRPEPHSLERTSQAQAVAPPTSPPPRTSAPRTTPTLTMIDEKEWERRRPLLPTGDADYLTMRDAVVRLGVGALPPARGAMSTEVGRPTALDELLSPSADLAQPEPSSGSCLKRFLTGDFL